MSNLEVSQLVVRLSAIVDTLEKRIDGAARQSHLAAQALDLQSRKSLQTSDALVRQSLEQFHQGARQAIEEGARDAIDGLDQTLRGGAHRIDHTLSQLDQRARQMGRVNVLHAWKTFVATASASLAVAAVAIYLSVHAHGEIKRAEWVHDINAAIESGRLTACPEGGLCVQVNNKWVRLNNK